MSFLTTLAIVSIQAICIGYSCVLGAKLCDKLYTMNRTYPVVASCLGFPLAILVLALAIGFDFKGDLAMTLELSSFFFVGGICARGQYYYSENHRK